MTLQEQRDMIQAAIDGKSIQYRRSGSSEWEGACTFGPGECFDFHSWEYRVKPEPREWWVLVDKLGNPLRVLQDRASALAFTSQFYPDQSVVKVREIVD